jgi:RNA polymerase sigma factor (sigma-70 family)
LDREEEQNHINQVILRDPDAVRTFVAQYKNLFYSTINGFSFVARSEVDDYFSAFFVRLFEDDCRRLTLWNRDCKLSTYLVTILKNYLKDENRKTRPIMENIEDDEAKTESSDENIEHNLYIRDLLKNVGDSIASLTERDQDLINRTFLKEEDAADIADALGINVNAYYQAISRAQKRLLDHIREEFPFLIEEFSSEL